MSITDFAWVLPALAGAAFGWFVRSKALALLLGVALLVTSVLLLGYSLSNYSNNDCQPGEPCPSGEQVIRVLGPVSFLGGSTLLLVAFGRHLRSFWRDLRVWRRRQRSPR